jgi:D-cysteine desulfhydrase
LWIKNDGSMGSLHGGNKFRKLGRILPLLDEQRVRHLVTSGAAGSHFALAVAILGRQLGYRVSVCLWPQPITDHVVATLAATVAHGAQVHPCPSPLGALRLARRLGKDHAAAGLLPGGLGAAATLAYSDAVEELGSQWQASGEPPPDEHVVACGTGGTAAGILLGCLAHRVPGRVVAVLVQRKCVQNCPYHRSI